MRNPSSCFVSWRISGATNLMWGPEVEHGAGVEEQKVERTGGEAGRQGGREVEQESEMSNRGSSYTIQTWLVWLL